MTLDEILRLKSGDTVVRNGSRWVVYRTGHYTVTFVAIVRVGKEVLKKDEWESEGVNFDEIQGFSTEIEEFDDEDEYGD